MAEVGDRAGVPGAILRRAVAAVLRGERAGRTSVTVTVLSVQRMRALNRRTFGRDRATDVIAFGMRHDRTRVGDVYVCPAVARRSARRFGVAAREEVLRLVVHGTLHVLGYDHPTGATRTRSAMWRRQERYLARLLRRMT
ncbi:MAG: rRNA maturation RNase YbeY [Gemmatimonadota bacterium]|nr:rRNA maturation RNase YbeY [Gemmatimonadota bacterium]